MDFVSVPFLSAVPNHPLIVQQFFETIELMHVQGPENNIKAVCGYLRADGTFGCS
jgi:hypothetical protein